MTNSSLPGEKLAEDLRVAISATKKCFEGAKGYVILLPIASAYDSLVRALEELNNAGSADSIQKD